MVNYLHDTFHGKWIYYSKINKLLSFKLSLMRMTTRVTQLKARKQNPSQRGNKSPTQHKQKANYKVNGSQIKLQSKTLHTLTHIHKNGKRNS